MEPVRNLVVAVDRRAEEIGVPIREEGKKLPPGAAVADIVFHDPVVVVLGMVPVVQQDRELDAAGAEIEFLVMWIVLPRLLAIDRRFSGIVQRGELLEREQKIVVLIFFPVENA